MDPGSFEQGTPCASCVRGGPGGGGLSSPRRGSAACPRGHLAATGLRKARGCGLLPGRRQEGARGSLGGANAAGGAVGGGASPRGAALAVRASAAAVLPWPWTRSPDPSSSRPGPPRLLSSKHSEPVLRRRLSRRTSRPPSTRTRSRARFPGTSPPPPPLEPQPPPPPPPEGF